MILISAWNTAAIYETKVQSDKDRLIHLFILLSNSFLIKKKYTLKHYFLIPILFKNNIKGGNKMIDFLCLDLMNSNKIQLSIYPDNPGTDELVDYKYVSHKIINTNMGKVMILDLKNASSGEFSTYAYNDIEDVTLNDNSTEISKKYYISCINRARKLVNDELEEQEKLGYKLNNCESDTFYHGYIDTYRILINS